MSSKSISKSTKNNLIKYTLSNNNAQLHYSYCNSKNWLDITDLNELIKCTDRTKILEYIYSEYNKYN